MINSNPFSFAKASDYSDEEINKLWIDISENFVEAVIEPTLRKSKFILGGKGTGKTHLLRHYSYNATKLRSSNLTGLDIVNQHQSLGVFLRANALDASRFICLNDIDISKWQQLFGVHLELKLAEDLLDINRYRKPHLMLSLIIMILLNSYPLMFLMKMSFLILLI